MRLPKFSRLPEHIGVIPDGNRRWAQRHGLPKEAGYERGIGPGFRLYELCLGIGIKELTLYGFTQDNAKRPSAQTRAFRQACVASVRQLAERDAALLVVGDTRSRLFPRELLPFTGRRVVFGRGAMRVNFLVNYGWQWDLETALSADGPSEGPRRAARGGRGAPLLRRLASAGISRVDLVIRWGGRRRLSGFLPVQCVYADFYIVDALWPDFEPKHLFDALRWYERQDVTLGG